MAKKKTKKSGKEQHSTVPTEWVGKSLEELKELVDQLQCDLNEARNLRNLAQTEFASIQSYYDVTRENIRVLDMRVEKQDLEVENVQEDNESEFKVYDQKSKFLNYCHEQQLKQTMEETDSRTKESIESHANQVERIKAQKTGEAESDELEKRLVDECSSTRTKQRDDVSRVKRQLSADVRLFEKQCEAYQTLLKEELDTRRTSELHAIESRKNSHLKDIMSSHERACSECRSYFDGVERQQSIDIEELQAQIRRLKKVAEKNESDSNNLKESNRIHGEDLQICSNKVSNLKSQTKDLEKDRTSLAAANARLSATRKAIRQTRDAYNELEEKVAATMGEIDLIKNQSNELNSSSVVSCNAAKRDALRKSLERQQKKNESVDRHRSHVVASAGLIGDASNDLAKSTSDFVNNKNKEIEKLSIEIAHAKQQYKTDLNTYSAELKKCAAASAEDVNSLDVTRC